MTPGPFPPRQAHARIAFIRALAAHTDAIRELRAWRPPAPARASERVAAQQVIDSLADETVEEADKLAAVPHVFDRAALVDLLGRVEVTRAIHAPPADPLPDLSSIRTARTAPSPWIRSGFCTRVWSTAICTPS